MQHAKIKFYNRLIYSDLKENRKIKQKRTHIKNNIYICRKLTLTNEEDLLRGVDNSFLLHCRVLRAKNGT